MLQVAVASGGRKEAGGRGLLLGVSPPEQGEIKSRL